MEDESSDQTPKQVLPETSSEEDTLEEPQAPPFIPIMYPAFVPGLLNIQNQEQMNRWAGLLNMQNQEQMNRGAGIYAVPVHPFMGPIAGYTPNSLIPLTYSVPTSRRSSSEAPSTGEQPRQVGAQQPQQQAAPQRQVVVRRFQIAIHLDLMLILKLAAIIFLFNQEGSRQRLVLLVFFAALIYLYQTGALSPLIRWLSQGMQRPARPPQPPRPAARAEDGNENAVGAEAQVEQENGNQANEENRAVENEQVAEPGPGNRWWGIVKEIQLFVFGFITSLLPGFHNID